MRITVAQLRAAGLTEKQIVRLCALVDDEREAKQRTKWRNDKRRQRGQMSTDVQADGVDQVDKVDPPSYSPLPSILEPSGSNISGRAKRKPKVPLPDDFNPVISITDGEELERFKDHARSTARLCADWNAAWRNWLRSPYRKPNGGHPNGQGRRHGSLLDAFDRLDAKLSEGAQEVYTPRTSEVDRIASAHGHRCISKG
jgi:hypothetical protein